VQVIEAITQGKAPLISAFELARIITGVCMRVVLLKRKRKKRFF